MECAATLWLHGARIVKIGDDMSRARTVWLLLAIGLCGAGACTRPENGKADPFQALDPFCRYDPPVRQHAVIEVDGEQLEDTIVVRRSRSREWIQQMNASGCGEMFGTALAFRTRDGRAILMRPRLCRAAEDEETANVGEEVDVCTREAGRRPWPEGVVIDSADHPATWMAFDFDADSPPARLVSLTTQRTREAARDNIDVVAPVLLRTYFADPENHAAVGQMINFRRKAGKGPGYRAVEAPVDDAALWRAPPAPSPQASADPLSNGVGRQNYVPPYYKKDQPRPGRD